MAQTRSANMGQVWSYLTDTKCCQAFSFCLTTCNNRRKWNCFVFPTAASLSHTAGCVLTNETQKEILTFSQAGKIKKKVLLVSCYFQYCWQSSSVPPPTQTTHAQTDALPSNPRPLNVSSEHDGSFMAVSVRRLGGVGSGAASLQVMQAATGTSGLHNWPEKTTTRAKRTDSCRDECMCDVDVWRAERMCVKLSDIYAFV